MERTPGHYPITLGCVAEALGLTYEEGLESLCYGVVSGLVSAAVRLVPLGQTEGQRVISNLEGAVREAVETATALSLEDAHSWGAGARDKGHGRTKGFTRACSFLDEEDDDG